MINELIHQQEEPMTRVLVVKNPFGGRGIGDRITDPAEIGLVLAGEHSQHVVQAVHADAHHAVPEIEETTTEEE
jgi:hypothetical protein